jgi:hypothetical protein
MRVGQVQRNPATGKIQRNPSTGKIIRASDSTQGYCCCAGGCKCGPDGTSFLGDTIAAFFSDVVIPIGICFSEGGGSARVISIPINGLFDLTREDGSCIYSATIPGSETDLWVPNPNAGPIGCDCDSYLPGCDRVVLTAGIRVRFVWFEGFGAVPYVNVGGFPAFSVNPNAFGSGIFNGLTFNSGVQDLTDPAVLPCGGDVTLDNTQWWTGPIVNPIASGVFLNFDGSVLYPYPGFSAPLPPGVTNGGWPPPHTDFGGSVMLADTP